MAARKTVAKKAVKKVVTKAKTTKKPVFAYTVDGDYYLGSSQYSSLEELSKDVDAGAGEQIEVWQLVGKYDVVSNVTLKEAK